MYNQETDLEINDYLDLYLLTGSIGAASWQQEVLGKLKNFHNKKANQDPSLTIQSLWKEYKQINMEILALYEQLKNDFTNDELQEKIWRLKQQRLTLNSKIQLKERIARHNIT